jgi:hypothetical protein
MQGGILLAARWQQPTCRCLYGSWSKRSYRQHAPQVHNLAQGHRRGYQTAGSEFHVAITSSIHTPWQVGLQAQLSTCLGAVMQSVAKYTSW